MIKVIIERTLTPGLEIEYEQAARAILQATLRAEGYISGESLKDANNPNHRFIITLWRDKTAWHRWETSEERYQVLTGIAPLLSGDEKVTILEHL
ncbi:Heme-degrading monooxygenase HmoA [Allopseudospirillum japonicum]|uniref:Heme-degrading monooxygenase HmoA n=1 Tax=Allopseudospirillum japonicum TaxID=64971 RepID=A0A1H6RJX8_9GAMM|nr:antibiotic biosynthesis monooxygenase family protein [Allopseudospirillum japonicum]SEI56118.1 Heme-degrading monooxygenase HmoA [Allopseudospirillum japonicum]